MKISRKLLASLLALLPLSATPVLASETGPDYDMISLQAEARAEAPNDLLVATFYVEMTMTDATKLASEVNRTLNNGVRLVHDFPSVKIESGPQSTWPVYDAKNKLTGWRTRAELRVESKDLDEAARVMAKLQATMQMGSLNFELSPDTADATSNRLIDNAMKAFSTRADIVAKSLGARSWRPVNLHVGTGSMQPMQRPMLTSKAMLDEAVQAPDVVGGSSSITVNIGGTIQLLR